MVYKAKDYTGLIGMEGFGKGLLRNHFTLYQGYVTNTNKLIETLAQMVKDGKTATAEFSELKRRFGWEFNGMRLHEYYFENLGGKVGIDTSSRLFNKITEAFGSYKSWELEFKTIGSMRGIGWVVLYQDALTGHLFNVWINEHDAGHLSGCLPILVLDMFEHAFMLDYGVKRGDYIEAFFKNINWQEAEKRVK